MGLEEFTLAKDYHEIKPLELFMDDIEFNSKEDNDPRIAEYLHDQVRLILGGLKQSGIDSAGVSVTYIGSAEIPLSFRVSSSKHSDGEMREIFKHLIQMYLPELEYKPRFDDGSDTDQLAKMIAGEIPSPTSQITRKPSPTSPELGQRIADSIAGEPRVEPAAKMKRPQGVSGGPVTYKL